MKSGISLTIVLAAFALGFTGTASAKLPAPTEEQQTKAAEAKAKADHGSKVAAFQLCKTMNGVADRYANEQKAKGNMVKPMETPPCADPGPFVPPQAAAPPAPEKKP